MRTGICHPDDGAAARLDELLGQLRLRIAIAIKADVADQAAALRLPLPPGADLTREERAFAERMIADPDTVGDRSSSWPRCSPHMVATSRPRPPRSQPSCEPCSPALSPP